MLKYLLWLWCLFALVYSANAQSGRISVTAEYNIPLGELAWMYKPGVGILAGYSTVDASTRIVKTMGFSIGFTKLAPTADTLYFVIDKGGVNGLELGKASFSDFKWLQIKGTASLAFPLGKKFALETGATLGIIYGSREMYIVDGYSITDSAEKVMWATLSPSLGFECKFSDKISLTPFISYSLMIQAGNANSNAIDYNENTGIHNHFYSTGVTLHFYLP